MVGFHDDTIYLTDGERDRVISCGPGEDIVYFDGGIDKFEASSRRLGNRCENRQPQ